MAEEILGRKFQSYRHGRENIPRIFLLSHTFPSTTRETETGRKRRRVEREGEGREREVYCPRLSSAKRRVRDNNDLLGIKITACPHTRKTRSRAGAAR